MNIYVDVKESDQPEGTIAISKYIIEMLHLVPGTRYRLKFGQCNTEVMLTVCTGKEHSMIEISTVEFKYLCIPENTKLGLAAEGSEIILGPLLGVFVNPRYYKRIERPSPPGGCTHMIKANENEHMFIYFFTINNIDWQGKKAEGRYYSQKEKTWVKGMLPLPDIVYDRGVFSRKEGSRAANCRSSFSRLLPIKRINPGDCLDKYYVYEKLRKYFNLRRYLPETIRFNGMGDLISMLKKYPTVYLKSFYGSLGSEVMAVALNRGSAFHCTFFDHGVLKTSMLTDAESLHKLVAGFFKNKEFIVQQGIDLLEYNDSRVDMRLLLQKDGSGRWACVYNVAFLGQKGSLITAGEEKGAKPYSFTDIMPLVLNISPMDVMEINNRIIDVCKNFCNAIDREYGSFGEIGIDMALDKNLNIWYIEANSKPDRELENSIAGNARCAMSCMYLIKYAKYLTGF